MGRDQSGSFGVLLIVVLLLVLAGTFWLYGDAFAAGLTEPAQVHLDATQTGSADPAEAAATVAFAHTGGDALPAADVFVVVDGERVERRENLTVHRPSSTFEIGERIVVEQTAPDGLTGGEELTLVYQRGDARFGLRTVTVRGADGG